ncbi:MAG: sulfite exporter TauE/SafE family protein, partial [Defluviitaleaceae bacterium]|nr:sulfite exporter TauE/SafE family protein [Defluviitaleaceae bacterium]
MIGLIYFIIILLTSILGAVVGLGGGIFIRPIFDALGHHNVVNIAFFVSIAIITMSVVSTAKKIKDGQKINFKVAGIIAIGAAVGGILGDILRQMLLGTLNSESNFQLIQIIATVFVILIALFLSTKTNLRYEIKSPLFPPIFGVILGIIASFLSIGGGILNVPIFMILFGMSIKDATTNSLVVVLVSQIAGFINMVIAQGFYAFDLGIVPFVVVAAAVGGLLGARLTKIFSENTVKRLFQGTLVAVMLLNIANALFFL